jgi:hypothetical protein
MPGLSYSHAPARYCRYVDVTEAVESFGAAIEANAATVLIGAGLSKDAGYPDWMGVGLKRSTPIPMRRRRPDQLMTAWSQEPPILGEERWTPWGHGWHAWSGPSAEVEFCEFVGALTALMRPKLVVETGVGVGYSTRRIIAQLPEDGRWIGFESDADFRSALRSVLPDTLTLGLTPSADDIAKADLVLLDSSMEFRLTEFDLWQKYGKPGSILVCHDVSNRHRLNKIHTRLHDHISASGMTGIFLSNPRGAWMGQHP